MVLVVTDVSFDNDSILFKGIFVLQESGTHQIRSTSDT
jgi:hypothetical protein